MDWASVLSAVLGGFLAAGAGWFVDWRREERRFSRSKALLATGIVLDLEATDRLFSNLRDEFHQAGYVSFAMAQAIRESRHIYEQNKNWIILFEKDVYTAIFEYYTKSFSILAGLEQMQRRIYELQKVAGSSASVAEKQSAAYELAALPNLIERSMGDFSQALSKMNALHPTLEEAAGTTR
jgi:hypothetical protein